MKSNKIIVFLVVSLFIGLTACEKEYNTADLTTRTTYYAVFDMKGETSYTIPVGGEYSDPGCTASENGSPLEVDINTEGTYSGYSDVDADASVSDQYITYYSAENSDGYSIAAERYVWVAETGDLTTNIAGLYTSSISRMGTPAYDGVEYILITKTGDNTYSITDAVGGYYYLARAYGFGYAAQGSIITANDIPNNEFIVTDAIFPNWGNTVVVTDFLVDAETKTISFTGTGDFNNGVFTVELTQVQL